jgi:RNA polymerase sigma-70 factor (ECF subfamily)
MHDEAPIRAKWDAGDVSGAASLAIAQLGPEVLGYLVGTLADPDLADDAFSGFCERLWSSFSRFEWRCSVRTWAYTLAHRASADAVRANWRHQRRQRPLSDSRVAAIADQVRTTTLAQLKTAGKNALLRLRDELPQADRTLLTLRVDRALGWNELARVFLENDSPTDEELRRESARLRKRFQLVKARLRKRAEAAGLLGEDSDT